MFPNDSAVVLQALQRPGAYESLQSRGWQVDVGMPFTSSNSGLLLNVFHHYTNSLLVYDNFLFLSITRLALLLIGIL